MATINPARMLGWDRRLGSIEPGKLADLVVVNGTSGPAYTTLVDATEADISLVVINGIPRVGTPPLMSALGAADGGEGLSVGGQPRTLNLTQAAADPSVAEVSVEEAGAILAAALSGLPDHSGAPAPVLREGAIRLAVSGLVDNQMSPRHHLRFKGHPTGPNRPDGFRASASGPLPPLPALTLDPLTAIDDPTFYATVSAERNVPEEVRQGLATYAPTRSH
jgi:hypothetical protein